MKYHQSTDQSLLPFPILHLNSPGIYCGFGFFSSAPTSGLIFARVLSCRVNFFQCRRSVYYFGVPTVMQRGMEVFTPLFRMRKLFENERLALFKIEGALTRQNAESWEEELTMIIQRTNRPIIFDCASLTVNYELTDILRNLMTDQMYFLNLPTPARNILRTAGFGARVLD